MTRKLTNITRLPPNLSGEGVRIGIVQSRFNPTIGEGLINACSTELLRLKVGKGDILIVSVPGALEIPLMLQKLALTEEFDALIAVGAVIRGETYHFELVCNQSAAGISQVALEMEIPVINAVLTTENDAQAEARVLEKGTEAARAAVEMANLADMLDAMAPDPDDLDLFDDSFEDIDDDADGDSDANVRDAQDLKSPAGRLR